MSKKVTFSRNLIRGGLGWLVGFLGVLLVEEVRSFIYPNNGARMEVRPLFENQFQPNFSDSNPSVPGSIPNSYSVKLSVYQSSVYLTLSFNHSILYFTQRKCWKCGFNKLAKQPYYLKDLMRSLSQLCASEADCCKLVDGEQFRGRRFQAFIAIDQQRELKTDVMLIDRIQSTGILLESEPVVGLIGLGRIDNDQSSQSSFYGALRSEYSLYNKFLEFYFHPKSGYILAGKQTIDDIEHLDMLEVDLVDNFEYRILLDSIGFEVSDHFLKNDPIGSAGAQTQKAGDVVQKTFELPGGSKGFALNPNLKFVKISGAYFDTIVSVLCKDTLPSLKKILDVYKAPANSTTNSGKVNNGSSIEDYRLALQKISTIFRCAPNSKQFEVDEPVKVSLDSLELATIKSLLVPVIQISNQKNMKQFKVQHSFFKCKNLLNSTEYCFFLLKAHQDDNELGNVFLDSRVIRVDNSRGKVSLSVNQTKRIYLLNQQLKIYESNYVRATGVTINFLASIILIYYLLKGCSKYAQFEET